MRSAFSCIILTSLCLHSLARLGILSYAYENRKVIAFELGLIDEVPITKCSSEYVDEHLVISTLKDIPLDEAVPLERFKALEIILFFNKLLVLSADLEEVNLARQFAFYCDIYSFNFVSDLLRPPSL